jgi:hypothetical protein
MDIYAAKCFKFVGNLLEPITAKDNLAHLKQELCHYGIAIDIGANFV